MTTSREAFEAWQLIETAPRDGTHILLRATVGPRLKANPKTTVGRYSRGWWSDGHAMTLTHLTHWMPLPVDPKEGT